MGFVSAQCTCSRATPEHAVPPFPPTRTSAAAHVSALRAWALAHAGWRYMESGLALAHVSAERSADVRRVELWRQIGEHARLCGRGPVLCLILEELRFVLQVKLSLA